MQLVLIMAISIHVLARVLWAGPNIAIARNGGLGAERLFSLKMAVAAALMTIVSGWYRWRALHDGSFGATEQSLGFGVAAAIIALAIQAGLDASSLATGDGQHRSQRPITRREPCRRDPAVATIPVVGARYGCAQRFRRRWTMGGRMKGKGR